MKKIVFAILVHEKREIVDDLLRNVRKFCPNSDIVLYNGGTDPNLLNGVNVPVCPTSKPLNYGLTTCFFILETMKWLDRIDYDFDILVCLDSDALFGKSGFEEFLSKEMEDKEFLGIECSPSWDNHPCRTIKKEWHKWEPIMKTSDFYWCFNVAQTFSKKLVKEMVHFEDILLFTHKLHRNTAFAAEEIVYVTLVKRLGYDIPSYPSDLVNTVRYRPHFTKDEVIYHLNNHEHAYLFHPVYRENDDEVRQYIRSL
ncbi:hypothetical protein [Neobacillus dielmonensis]|uniref:hypothetical protein n=1 Tax=Neobacillus dielmonensis TaxID=1347369 RepID=UPI0005A920C0|nr:hypothetical protein [Neobacillus dielmonensis]